MIKKAMHTAVLVAILATAAACQQDEALEGPGSPLGRDNGFVKLEFRADIPALEIQSVDTRAVDPDGGGVRDMTLFCFDDFGLFITTATADVSPKGNTPENIWGTFTAEVPHHTRRIHFIANQNMTDFAENDFVNRSESDVLALLEGSAGHMIYWSRFACSPDPASAGTTIAEQLEAQGGKITMLRNHALVTVSNPTTNNAIKITGMAAYNIQAYGTVAPYDPVRGFDFTPEQWRADNYVTIPKRNVKQSDIMDVTANTSQFIFEHENTSNDPVSIILRGHAPDQTSNDDLYYRVLLYNNQTGEFFPVRRNYRYILTINGELSFGQPTFEQALTAPATNNVWVSISDDVNEVEDKDYILRVNRTSLVLDGSELDITKSVYFNYTLKAKNPDVTLTQADKPSVTWIDNTVASQDIRNDEFEITGNVGVGNIAIAPRQLGSNERLEGTLLVKYGRLERKIKLIVIKKQTFIPSWISTGLYGGDENAEVLDRSHVTLMFTIPESCPAELFPMNVYITADMLDIRNASGMVLPVVRKGDEQWYQSIDGPENADYKFVYTIHEPGPFRIYFENILYQKPGSSGKVYIEAPHFATMSRTYNFASTKRRFISIEPVGEYNAQDPAIGATDVPLYYYRVPQKTGAPVEFDVRLYQIDETTGEKTPINASDEGKDEFLLYTQNLNNYVHGEYPGSFQPNCIFSLYTDKAEAWMLANNPGGGRMLMFKPREGFVPDAGNTGKYTIHLYTNCANNAEVLRFSSNINDMPAVSQSDPDDTNGVDDKYGGLDYRSFVVELTNYTPFRFGARVRYDGGEWMGEEPDRSNPRSNVPETVTPLVWTFEPDRKVDIAVDVTSFAGLADTKGDDTAADRVSVDPFGRAFEIYIDAPMLKIDRGRLAECNLNANKLRADPTVPGRFIYTVEADRNAERAFGSGDPVVNADQAPTAEDQTGERKVLPFVVGSVASAGDIVISSNKEQIVFYDKTFRVTNESITGEIVYEVHNDDGSITQVPVPDDEFVAFERVTNNNRIGAVNLTGNGKFELRLRKEYTLNWLGFPVAFHYEHEENGISHLHHAEYATLADMYAAIKRGETVVLKPDIISPSSATETK